MTTQSASSSDMGVLASLRVQVRVNGGPEKKADLVVHQGGLIISWSIGLFGQKHASNPEGIIIRCPDLILAHVTGLPASECPDSEPFARMRVAQGAPTITLFTEKDFRVACRPTFSNDPAAFVLAVRAMAFCIVGDNNRRLEAGMAELEERRFQEERRFVIERAQRYVGAEPFTAAVHGSRVLPGGEIPGYFILFFGFGFFDKDDISDDDEYTRHPFCRYPDQLEFCIVSTPGGVALSGQGVPLYRESESLDGNIHMLLNFGSDDDFRLRVPYSTLPPVRQQECVESLNTILQSIAETFAAERG